MTVQLITEEQALFLATLPDVFCDLSYAIRVHAFINRVPVINEDAARDAIEYGLGAKVVETDGEGQLRLADHLKRERQKLEASEGYFEVAVFEVSRAILKQAEQTAAGDNFPPSGMTAPEQWRSAEREFTPTMKTTAFLLTMLVPAVVSAQQKPTTGYAPVNGLKMYYEVHGSGEPVVLLHGAFMTITNNWEGWIGELSKTRKMIAVEMQGHGRTADIERDISQENLADDVAALLDHLKIPKADLIGYSMGGGVAMQCAVRHPDKVRNVVVISSTFRRDGMVKEALNLFPKLSADAFKGSPIEAEYKKLSPTPDDFPKFVKRVLAAGTKGHDLGADKLKATRAPMFFIHGDADGIRLEHVAEMFRLKGGGTHGDMGPRAASRLAILPDTTHVTLMQRMPVIVPMVNDFLDAKPQKQ